MSDTDLIGRLAEKLNDALDSACDLFSSRFRSPAEVPYANGERFLGFKKVGDAYSFVDRQKNCPEWEPLMTKSLGIRVLSAPALHDLWRQCEVQENEMVARLKDAEGTVLDFVASKRKLS